MYLNAFDDEEDDGGGGGGGDGGGDGGDDDGVYDDDDGGDEGDDRDNCGAVGGGVAGVKLWWPFSVMLSHVIIIITICLQ